MRTSLSGYYRNLEFNQNNTAKELFDVTKQISSGQKIQYAYDDNSTFIDAVRLDNEVTTLTQVKKNAQKALQVSSNTDSTMVEMTNILDAMKVKLVYAANESHSDESLNAIARELRGLENNLIQLANTSIDGQYLFSGSDVTTKTIDSNGVYQGNDKDIKAFIGSGISQTYNINGADLFFGDENDTERNITTNIPILNKTELYPYVMGDSNDIADFNEVYINENDTIRDMIGDTNRKADLEAGRAEYLDTHFYLRGTDHNGDSFKQRISMEGSDKISVLLDKIGAAYGNTALDKFVDVTLNAKGEIEILDRASGSSKLDFHLVAATDFDTASGSDRANVLNLDYLDAGTSSFEAIVKGTTSNKLLITEFMRSGLDVASVTRAQVDTITVTDTGLTDNVDLGDNMTITIGGTPYVNTVGGTLDVALADIVTQIDADPAYNAIYDAPTNTVTVTAAVPGTPFTSSFNFPNAVPGPDAYTGAITTVVPNSVASGSLESLRYDEFYFTKDGVNLTSNMPQILKTDNSYATPSTKLVDVASGATVVGTVLDLKGTTIDGDPYDIQINISTPGSWVSGELDGVTITDFNIFNTTAPRAAVNADEMTYQQLSDVINMVVTGDVPDGTHIDPTTALPFVNPEDEYDFVVKKATESGSVTLDHQGKLSFTEENTSATTTLATLALNDRDAADIFNETKSAGSTLSFQNNNALTISDPKTDFFRQISEAISAVEQARIRPDGTLDDPRNVGVQNGIQALEDLSRHMYNQHSVAGVQSQTLQVTSDRTDILIVNTKILRSETLDVDIAEASLELQQLQLNYQAMLSTVSRVSQLSLVNYL